MTPKNHVVITGTGRSGTTFLVELMTRLGLDTGFSLDDLANKKSGLARAGLEYHILNETCPYIVKSPLFCDFAHEVICRQDFILDHVFVPIRNLTAAAESRRLVTKANVSNLPLFQRLKHMIKPEIFDGGLWQTRSCKSGKQEEILLKQIYNLMLALSDTDVPITLLRYPRIVKDSAYLFEKLKPILREITYESFCEAFHKTVRLELVNSFNKNDV
jgi:hypothetical protein